MLVNDAVALGRRILFEGAQGTMLDIDHGTYPYVSSSSSTVGGICVGLGVSPRAIGGVLGIVKAYTTRVGEGPMPTEANDETVKFLRDSGKEYGASTGRPRRCGWFDAVVARYAARINGLEAFALTKLDVLDGLSEIKICTEYRYKGKRLTEFPIDRNTLNECIPEYETLPGWSKPTAGLQVFDDLPSEAQRYIAKVEKVTGVPVAIISTGSDRKETIVRKGSIVSKWLGD
jgi:adenylosuccinate synthase